LVDLDLRGREPNLAEHVELRERRPDPLHQKRRVEYLAKDGMLA